jgi:hypothetical protein
MSHASGLVVSILLTLGVAACGAAKKEAEEALARAERFYGGMETEARKVLPAAVQPIADSLKQAKDLFAAGSYAEARAAAVNVAGEAVRVAKLVPGKRNELDSTYKVTSIEITGPVRQVVGKIQQHRNAGSVPRGMTRASFDSLRQDVATWEGEWKKAEEHYQKGEIGPAASQALKVRTSIVGAMKLLGIR